MAATDGFWLGYPAGEPGFHLEAGETVMSMRRAWVCAGGGLVALGLAAVIGLPATRAADVVKADNETPLADPASWTLGVAPGTGDVGLWDNSVTTATSVELGGNLSWQGLRLADPGGDVTITGGNTLTLGSAGLDTGNTVGLTYAATGTLDLNGPLAGSTSFTLNNNTTQNWTGMGEVSFTGTIALRGGSAAAGSFSNNWLAFGGATVTQTGAFALDTGASLEDRGDFIVTDGWGDGTTKPKLTLSSLTGFGDFRSDWGPSSIRTVLVDQDSDTTYQGRIVSNNLGVRAINLEKAGTGRLTLTGASSINATTVTAGTLTVSGGGSIGGGRPLDVAAGATFEWAKDGTVSSAITGAGTLVRSTTGGNALFSGDNTGFSGAWLITSGNVGLNGDSSVGAADVGMTLDGGGIYFIANGSTLAASRTITLGAGGGRLDGSTGSTYTFASTFTGSGGLTKVSGARAILTAANDFSGDIGVAAGTLEIGGAGSLGGAGGQYAGQITVAANTALAFTTSVDQELAGVISGEGVLIQGGPATLTLTADNTFAGGTGITAGRLQVGNGGTSGSLGGAVIVDAGSTLAISRADSYDFAGTIEGEGVFEQAGPGTLTFSGTSIATGGTRITGGTFEIDTDADLGAVPATATADNVVLDGGTLGVPFFLTLEANRGIGVGSAGGGIDVAEFATLSYAGVIADAAGGGGGTLTKSGAGTLSLTGVSTYTGGTTITAGSLELSGSSQLGGGVYAGDLANDGTLAVATSANQTLSGVISGTGSLTKSGTGTLTLAGANTFSGPTALTQGTLVVAAGGSLAGSAVAVGNSTTLAGAGGVGDTTVSFGGTLAPGVAGAGTLTLSSLTLGEFAFDSSTIAMPVSGSGTLDSRLAVTGDLTANGGASSVTFALGSNLSLLDSGTYTLVSYGGSQLADVSAFTFTGTQGGRQTVSLENGTQSIDLLVGNAFLTWSGAEGPGWSTTDNWILSSDSQPTTFLSSDTVVFDDSGTSGAVELTSSVSPTTVTFSGDTLDYTLSSTGGAQIISGNLLKTGAATVTIDASNSYFGGTTVSAGTLVVNAIDGLGTGAVSVSGGLVQLNAASNSAGGVTISGGGVRVADDSALGFGTVTLAGGTLAASGSDPRTLSNTLTVTADSTLGDATDNGPLALTGSVGLAGGTRTLTVASPVTISGGIGDGGLVKAGDGPLTLSGFNFHTGGTTVAAGSLLIGSASALGSGPVGLQGGTFAPADASDLEVTAATTVTGPVTLGAAGSGGLTFSQSFSLGGGSSAISIAAPVSITGTIGNGTLVKAGPETLTLSGTNTYAGGTTVLGGTILVSADGALGSAGTVTLGGAAAGSDDVAVLLDTSAGSVTIPRAVAVSADGTGTATLGSSLMGEGNQAIFSGPISLGRGLTLAAADGGDRTQFSGGISGTGDVTVTTAGTGRVILIGQANTFTGNVTITDNSVLQLSDGSVTTTSLLPDSATVTVGAGGSLRLAKQRSESIDVLAGSGTVESLAGTNTLVVGSADGSGSFDGVLGENGGVLAVTKVGTGTQTFTAANAYTGPTRVEAGTLAFTSDNSLGSALTSGIADTTGVVQFGANTITIGNAGANSTGFYYGTLDGTGTLALRGGSSTIAEADGTAGTSDNFAIFVPSGSLSPTAFALDTGPAVDDRKDFAYINDTGDVLTLSSLTGYGAIRNDAGGTAGEAVTRQIVVDQATDTTFNGALLSHRSSAAAERLVSLEKRGEGSLTLAGFIGKETAAAGAGAAPVSLTANGGILSVTNAANTTTTNAGAISLGTVTVTSGTLAFSDQALVNTDGSAGATSILMDGGTLRWNPGTTQDITAGGRLSLVDAKTASFDTNGNDVTLATPFGGGAIAAAVTKAGTGTLTLAAATEYTGPTTVASGTLALGAAATLGSSSLVQVDAGATFDVSALPTAYEVASTQTLAGAGTVTGAAVLATGATVAPGEPVGTLTTSGDVTFGGGGNYNWQVLDAAGTAGSAEGWDLLSVGGALAITATAADPFAINLWSLSAADPLTSGPAANFDSTQAGNWTLLSAAGGITGFATDAFTIATAAANGTDGFANSLGSGVFSLAVNGNDLDLVFTPGGTPADIVIDVASGTETQAEAGYPLITSADSVTKTGLGTLVMDAANTYTGPTIVSAGTLEVADAAAIASSAVTVASGSTLSAAVGTTIQAPSVTVSGGTLAAESLAVNAANGIETLVVSSGTLAASSSVVVGAGGLMNLPVDGRLVLAAAGLEVDESGTGGLLDLGAGELAVAAGGITAADLRADIIAGRNGGGWDGTTGITSAAAAGSGGTRAVGYVVAGDGSARVSFAAPGDTDLSGQVNIIDLVGIDAAGRFGTGQPADWSQGDFNYDGVTNVLDLIAIDTAGAFGTGNYFPDPVGTTAALGSIAAVPEPGAVFLAAAGLAGLAGVAATRRCRRPE